MADYQQQAEAWAAERQAYLKKVQAGRSVRRVDPMQPAFSPQAEMVRQGLASQKAAMVEALMGRR